MFALGICLFALVSSATPAGLSSATPTAAANLRVEAANEAVASTYDEAACDLADSGECAPPAALLDLDLDLDIAPVVPVVLGCTDPRLGELVAPRIGSCDLPLAPSPRARWARLRNAARSGGRSIGPASRASAPMPAPTRVDDLHGLPVAIPTAVLCLSAFPIDVVEPTPPFQAAPSRLERPPRA
jgi:hypothetical protein